MAFFVSKNELLDRLLEPASAAIHVLELAEVCPMLREAVRRLERNGLEINPYAWQPLDLQTP